MLVTLRKITATNRITDLLSQWRIDREAFLIWKAQYLLQKQILIGLNILVAISKPVLRDSFNVLKYTKVH
jgi:hypothetical protein